jgi:hypothetical protein
MLDLSNVYKHANATNFTPAAAAGEDADDMEAEGLPFFSSAHPTYHASPHNPGPSGTSVPQSNGTTSALAQPRRHTFAQSTPYGPARIGAEPIYAQSYAHEPGQASSRAYKPRPASNTTYRHARDDHSYTNNLGRNHGPAYTHACDPTDSYEPDPTCSLPLDPVRDSESPACISTSAATDTRAPNPACSRTAASMSTRTPDSVHGCASGITAARALTQVPVYACGLDLANANDPKSTRSTRSADARSRAPAAILALASGTVPMSNANQAHVHPAHVDQPATDPGIRTTTLSPTPTLKPQQDTQSKSSKKAQARTSTKLRSASNSDSELSELSDTPLASESNRPIESDSEVSAKTIEEVEPVKPNGKSKGNNKGSRKKVSRQELDIHPSQ